ncbi:MAG: type II toxin-antitoxin system VapC family toxin [Candidatus Bilamarchaeaceae archaeon]
MEKILLDYYTALDFLRGEPQIVEKLSYYANTEEICISSVTLARLLFTIKKTDAIISFASSITVLPFDKKSAIIASKIKREMDERSIDPSEESIVTAAVCMANDAFLFTRRPGDFEGIRGLKRV